MNSITTTPNKFSLFANKKDLEASEAQVKRLTALLRANGIDPNATAPTAPAAPAKASTVKQGGGTLYAQYAALKKSDRIAASKFWEANKAAIATEIKK
jgi:hypothetical protein